MIDPNKKRRPFDIDDWAAHDEIPPLDDEVDVGAEEEEDENKNQQPTVD